MLKHQTVILVAPLDWGLGHSARCIPIIKHLINLNCVVIIAAEGKPYTLLKKEFPDQLFLSLKGYNVKYAGSKRFLLFKILCQLPKIFNRIKKENSWLKQAVVKYKIEGVISDNRYGLWHQHLSCVFITHQLQIKGPYKWIERLMLKLNYQQLNKFSRCWVPDLETEPNLAGALSHPAVLPRVPITYIGPLSRLGYNSNVAVVYDLLVLLSGPEPQRSLLENILLGQLTGYKGKVLFIRGLPGNNDLLPAPDGVTIVNHLPAKEMADAFLQSQIIICRAGYTTVMDVVKLGRKSIMIPTPGQTEQEYLARHLQQQKMIIAFEQDEFDLKKALSLAAGFNYQLPDMGMDNYKQVVEEWIAEIRVANG